MTTGAGQGAYTGRIALGLDASGQGLKVKVSLRVLDGNLGVGILTPDSKDFILERSVWPLPQMLEVALPLPSPPITGDLIIRNLGGRPHCFQGHRGKDRDSQDAVSALLGAW